MVCLFSEKIAETSELCIIHINFTPSERRSICWIIIISIWKAFLQINGSFTEPAFPGDLSSYVSNYNCVLYTGIVQFWKKLTFTRLSEVFYWRFLIDPCSLELFGRLNASKACNLGKSGLQKVVTVPNGQIAYFIWNSSYFSYTFLKNI